jgi:transposase
MSRPRKVRPVLNAITFRLRRSCQWHHLPERFPDDSTVRRVGWGGLAVANGE